MESPIDQRIVCAEGEILEPACPACLGTGWVPIGAGAHKAMRCTACIGELGHKELRPFTGEMWGEGDVRS